MMRAVDGPSPERTVQIVTDPGRLDDFAGIWRTRAVAAGNAFMTPEWYAAHLAIAEDIEPFVIVVGDESDPRLLLPLVRRRNVLRFAAASVGDRFGPLLRTEDDTEALEDGCAELLRTAPAWRLASLERVDAALAEDMTRALRRSGARLAMTDSARLPGLDLDGRTWDDYLSERSRNFRSELKRKGRALERSHRVDYVAIRDARDVADALSEHFALHELRWPVSSRQSQRARQVKRFHGDFARSAAARGWLRMWQLRVDERAIASWYGWNVGGRYAYYQAGLDPRWARFSPGTLLLAHTIREAIEEGCQTYEFLLGEESYKQRFGTRTHGVASLTVAPRRSLALAAAAGVWAARRGARRLPPPFKRALARAAGAVQ
jgi:CelD/BcsL family acetyltransferase involved in cellulose biosynthesis